MIFQVNLFIFPLLTLLLWNSGLLVQVREALRPDGFFLAALLGGDTLFELRYAIVS